MGLKFASLNNTGRRAKLGNGLSDDLFLEVSKDKVSKRSNYYFGL